MQRPITLSCITRDRSCRLLLLAGTAVVAAALCLEGILAMRGAYVVRVRTLDQVRAEAARKRLEELDPQLAKVVRRASEISRHGFLIVQGKRSQSEQDRLYMQGRGGAGEVVTWTRNSKHVLGQAIDFQPLDSEGRPTPDQRSYQAVASDFKRAATELGIRIDWGYDLWMKDLGHIELSAAVDR
jgi:peptidoglycan LD-endopeptidase CwlK